MNDELDWLEMIVPHTYMCTRWISSLGRARTKEMVLWCGGDAVCSVVIPSNIMKMVLL